MQAYREDSRNLDCLRAAAVLFVYVAHLQQFVLQLHFQFYTLARFGVLIFFVHTSLVLLCSLERSPLNGTATALNFYVRRIFRIYPLSLITVLALTVFHIPPAPDVGYTWIGAKQLASNLLLTQNLTGAESTPVTLWSLPFEVQMYAALPLLFVLFRNRSVWTGLVLWAGSTIAVYFFGGIFSGIISYIPCFLGGLVAYQTLRRRAAIPAQLWPAALLGIAALHWLLVKYKAPLPGLPQPVTCLTLGILIPLFKELPTSWLTKISHVIAKYSYGVYLSHLPVIWFAFVELRFAPAVARWAVLGVLSVIIPWVLYHLLEHPMIRFGRSLADRICRKLTAREDYMAQTLAAGEPAQ